MTTESLLRLPATERDSLELIDALGHGLPVRALPYFKRVARLSDNDFARHLGLGSRTLTRLKYARAGRLSAEVSDRLYAVASIYALSEDVFGGRDVEVAAAAGPVICCLPRRAGSKCARC